MKKQYLDNANRYRNVELLVYLDNDDERKFATKETLENIENIDRFAISPIHNLDVDENGELKKPHFHVVIVLNNAKSGNAILTFFEKYGFVWSNLIDIVERLEESVLYLTHSTDKSIKDGKYGYARSEIVSNDVDWVNKCYLRSNKAKALLDDNVDAEMQKQCLEFLDSFTQTITRKQFVEYMCVMGIPKRIYESRLVMDEFNDLMTRQKILEDKKRLNEIQNRLMNIDYKRNQLFQKVEQINNELENQHDEN